MTETITGDDWSDAKANAYDRLRVLEAAGWQFVSAGTNRAEAQPQVVITVQREPMGWRQFCREPWQTAFAFVALIAWWTSIVVALVLLEALA